MENLFKNINTDNLRNELTSSIRKKIPYVIKSTRNNFLKSIFSLIGALSISLLMIINALVMTDIAKSSNITDPIMLLRLSDFIISIAILVLVILTPVKPITSNYIPYQKARQLKKEFKDTKNIDINKIWYLTTNILPSENTLAEYINFIEKHKKDNVTQARYRVYTNEIVILYIDNKDQTEHISSVVLPKNCQISNNFDKTAINYEDGTVYLPYKNIL